MWALLWRFLELGQNHHYRWRSVEPRWDGVVYTICGGNSWNL